jgi:hypothetical protein
MLKTIRRVSIAFMALLATLFLLRFCLALVTRIGFYITDYGMLAVISLSISGISLIGATVTAAVAMRKEMHA